MKKGFALIAAAVAATVLFAVITVGEIFLLGFLSVSEAPPLILFSYIAFAAVSYVFSLCIEKVKKFFAGKLSILPLAFYIAVFLPSMIFSGINLGLFIKRLNSGYYSGNGWVSASRQLEQYVATSYCAFIMLTAVFVFFINLYRKRKEKLDKQVEKYINDHKS